MISGIPEMLIYRILITWKEYKRMEKHRSKNTNVEHILSLYTCLGIMAFAVWYFKNAILVQIFTNSPPAHPGRMPCIRNN